MTAQFASYRGARVLVLGATGFIGSAVVQALHRLGAHLDLAHRHNAPEAAGTLHRLDLTDAEATAALVRKVGPALIFNLAGYGVDPGEKQAADARLARLLNTELPASLVTALAATPVAWPGPRLVHAGSILEYGPIGGVLSEERAAAPAGLYAETKLAGTRRVAELSRRFGLSVVTARLAQVYGPGEHPGRLLPGLIEARRTGTLGPLSRGTQRKDFTYVEDVAEGLLRLGLAVAAPGSIVNLATGRLTSVRDFALEAARLLPLPTELLRFEQPVPPGELEHEPVPTERLRSLVGWVPATGIVEGIQRTIAHTRTP